MPKVKKINSNVKVIEDKIKQLDTLQQKVIKRLPKIKKYQSIYDRTSRLYNLSPTEVKVKVSVLKKVVSSRKKNKAIDEFIKEAKKLIETPKEYGKDIIKERKKEFYKHLRDNVGMKDYRRANKLINMLTPEEQDEFFTSDKFFITPDYDSESWKRFMSEDAYGTSIEVAKLEDFVYEKGHKRINRTFDKYVKVDKNE